MADAIVYYKITLNCQSVTNVVDIHAVVYSLARQTIHGSLYMRSLLEELYRVLVHHVDVEAFVFPEPTI